MPPRRKVSAKRNNKSSSSNATTGDAHELLAPKVNSETELTDGLKAKETVPEIPIEEQVSDPNHPEIEVAGVSSESMIKKEVTIVDDVVKEDLQETVNADEEKQEVEEEEPEEELEEEPEEEPEEEEEGPKDEDGVFPADGSQLEKNAEINSAQEEMTAAQVDEFKILNDNNSDVQHSDISKSLGKNDSVVGNNGDVKGTTEMAIQESAQAVSTQTSCENTPALAVEDDSMEDMYSDESNDDSEGDGADNGGDEDQDPSLVVQDSSPDNKEKGTEIYVGRLDKNAVEEDLVNIFQQFGELKSTRIVRIPNSNKSKGYAFVRFASVDQANRALSELKDGVEVRGKRVIISARQERAKRVMVSASQERGKHAMISASQDNDTLYLGNICKTWTKEQLLQQLKEYGIEHIELLRLPEDTKIDRKNKGFAFLEFSTHSDAVVAFQRLRKPDVVFGRDISAKVDFAETPKLSSDEDLSKVHLEGLTKDWNEEKVKDICEKYGEVLKINLRLRTRGKRRDFGFVTFDSSESALACVEGINNAAMGGEAKLKASIANPPQKGLAQKKGFHGGFKVGKQSENSNKKSQPKALYMKGVLNAPQTKTNKKYPSKNKMNDSTVKPQQKGQLIQDGESSKAAELSKMKGGNHSQHGQRKRKASSDHKFNARDQGTPKKPRIGIQGQNSRSFSKAGSHKRKKASGNEVREDRGNRNVQGKKPFKKQKGNMHGRERNNPRKPNNDAHTRRGHDDYRNSTRYIDPYAPKYAASASNAYHVASDHSLSTRRYKEMEPHAGYIEPAFAKHSGSHSGYAQHVVRAPHSHLGPTSTGQSQLYPRYYDQPVMTQSHRGYIESQHYRDYRPSAIAQAARDPYDSGHARVVRHDDRGPGSVYAGGSHLPASQVPDRTHYYQAGGSYGGAYGTHGGYY